MRELDLTVMARGGILLTAWALDAGVSPGGLRGVLRTEGWQRLCRGAWAVPGTDVDWRTRARAIQLLAPELVCSHRTAAAVLRIELLSDEEDDVETLEFVHPRRAADRPGVRIHRVPALSAEDHVVRRGLRVTTPARTVADLMRAARCREEAVVPADSALARRVIRGVRRDALVDAEAVAAELRARRPGAPAARRWLRLTDPGAGSPAETVARLHLHDAGLRPECQPVLHTPSGRAVRPDFYFRAAGLVVEIEGYAFHGTRHAHERDIRRYNALSGCPGVRRILRFTAAEVFARPAEVVRTVAAALAGLEAEQDPSPPRRPRRRTRAGHRQEAVAVGHQGRSSANLAAITGPR
ncbi:hypothetical protein [Streptomyces tritici]|uniref:hypothetical protein n=1 Tax=Streptomyces tritici TaxID=2054410 RepID=UPI003AEF20FD